MSELIEVDGIEETVEMLLKLPKHVVARGFLRALRAGAAPMERELQIRTPSTTGAAHFTERREGDLRSAQVAEITLDSQFRGGTAEIGFGKQGHVANWVEYGHHMIGHKPDKKDLGEVEPHPFMSVAAMVSAELAIDAFAESIAATVAEEDLADVA